MRLPCPSTGPRHLVNSVNIGPGEWVTTYEEHLPLWNHCTSPWLDQFVWRRLAADSCRALIAMSEYAEKTLLRDLNKGQFPFRSEIRGKTHRIYPPQELLVKSVEEKPNGPPWKFVFVGIDFYLKGGAETVFAFDRLLNEGAPVQLHLVTKVTQRPDTRTTPERHRRVTSLIDEREGIVLHGKLPNDEVLDLLRGAHVGLLPSYSDTFGYSVLEAQAAGCPTITTNQKAFPEINSERTGWMIELPLNEERQIQAGLPYGNSEISSEIEEGIYSAVVEAIDTPAVIAKKGKAARERISDQHNPTEAATALRKLYKRMK